MGVKERIADLEKKVQGEQDFWLTKIAPPLRSFLDLIWSKRFDPNLDIYKLYCGRPHAVVDVDYGQPFDEGTARNFLSKLSMINREPQIQLWGTGLRQLEVVNTGLREGLLGDDSSLSFAKWLQIAQVMQRKWIYRDLAKSFFHFRTSGASAVHRIYLNILPMFRADVAQFVVQTVFPACSHVSNAKVLGPLNQGMDAMVIYLSNKTGESPVLDLIAGYQTRCGGYFSNSTIAIAKKVTEHGGRKLIGVACASEPYEHFEMFSGKKGKPSFGDFWETMLLEALKSSRNSPGVVAFYEEALKMMKRAGIDPLTPHI